jgi:hypothetical protein
MKPSRLDAIASEVYADMNRFQQVLDLLRDRPMCRHSSARLDKHLEQHCREQQQLLHAEYKRVAAKLRGQATRDSEEPT